MRRVLTMALTLILALALVTPALAVGKGPQPAPTAQKAPRGTIALVGYVRAVDAQVGTITVEVVRGNKLIQPYIGQLLVIKIDLKTRYLYKDGLTATATPIAFADIVPGDTVSVEGKTANGVWTAQRITVGADLSCFP